MARPEKINKELIDKIANYLRAGAYVETAAAASGINKETFYAWLKKGAVQKSGLYRQLSNAVEKAQAGAELRDLTNIDKAAMGSDGYIRNPDGSVARDKEGNPLKTKAMEPDWKASAWRLERRNPKHWGRREHVLLSNPDGTPIGSLTNEQATAEAEKILARIRGRSGGHKPK